MQINPATREYAKTALISTDSVYVTYDAEAEGSSIIIRRSVWNKAHRRNDREVLHEEIVALLTPDEAINLLRDLASSLSFVKREV